MLTASFDESGHSAKTDFLSVVAFVAAEDQWVEFSDTWNAALTQCGAPYLHMREFAHTVDAFKGRSEDQRRELMAAAVAAIASIQVTAVAAVMKVEDFRSFSQGANDGHAGHAGRRVADSHFTPLRGMTPLILSFLREQKAEARPSTPIANGAG